MKQFKRFISFLLVLTMLPISALAGGSITPGAGSGSSGSNGSGTAAGYTTRTLSSNTGAGLYLGVYTAKTAIAISTKEHPDASEKSFQQLLLESINDFPDITPSEGTYLLPTWLNGDGSVANSPSNTQYVVLDQWANQDTITNKIVMDTRSDFPNNLGADAYTTASSRSDVNLFLSNNYWQTLISNPSTQADCGYIVAHMFTGGPHGLTSTDKAQDMNDGITAYLDYNTADNNKDIRHRKEFLNYCGFLATVIAILPAGVRESRAKQLDGMCQNYLKGGAFNPMLVSGEVIYNSFFPDYSLNHWWRPRVALEAVTGVGWAAPAEGSTAANSIVKRFLANHMGYAANKGYYIYGDTLGSSFFHPHSYGSGTAPVVGPLLSSVDSSILSEHGVTFDGTVGGTALKPIEGLGIWGLSPDILTVIPTPPKLVPVGNIGLLVQEKTYEKAKGAYTQTFNLTVTVSLGANGLEEEGVAGFSQGLKWLAQKRDAGVRFDDPTIKIYLKQAEAIPALSGDTASNLINKTYGYYGDGTTSTDNSAGEQVCSNTLESGMGFTWKDCAAQLTLKDQGIKGMSTYMEGTALVLKVSDLWAAYEYFSAHSDTLTFVGEAAGSGSLSIGGL